MCNVYFSFLFSMGCNVYLNTMIFYTLVSFFSSFLHIKGSNYHFSSKKQNGDFG